MFCCFISETKHILKENKRVAYFLVMFNHSCQCISNMYHVECSQVEKEGASRCSKWIIQMGK